MNLDETPVPAQGRAAGEKYDVAIITVCRDKLDRACLESIARLKAASPLRIAFVAVDNASTDFRAHEYVTSVIPDAIVILREDNHGFGRSSNLGAAAVEADHYFLLNPDTRIDDLGLLEKLIAALREEPRIGIVAPRIRYMDGRVQETARRFPRFLTPLYQRLPRLFPKSWVRKHKDWFMPDAATHDSPRPVDWAQGSALLVDGNLWRELGGFDDRFWMYYEDIDLCRRAWDKGRAVYYVPSTELFHAYGKESARMKNLWDGLLRNPIARAHVASWLKYTLKWGIRDPL